MKKIVSAIILAIIVAQMIVIAASALVGNGNFETGDFSNWTKTAFINNGFSAAHSTGAGEADLSVIVGTSGGGPLSIADPSTGGNLLYPAYGDYSARVNGPSSYSGGGFAQNGNQITQTISAVLDPSDNLAHIRFTYSAVMVDPISHTAAEKPYFRVRVINTSNSNDVIYDFSSYVGEPGKNWQNGAAFNSESWKYIDWQYIDLASSAAHPVSAGDNITIEVTAAGCSLGGHPGYVYVDEFTDGDTAGPTIQASGPSTIMSGATITYTYNYHNGAGVSINPTITVNQPGGVTFTSVSDVTNCNLSSGTVTCNYTGVASGADDSFTINGTVTASGGSQIAHGDYDISASGFPTVGGPTVLTDVTGINVTINQAAGQSDPTNSGPVLFTATFSSLVTGFIGSDVSLGTSTTSGTLVASVTEVTPMNGTTYQVSVTGMTGSGNVIATIGSNVVNPGNAASTSTDNVVTLAQGILPPVWEGSVTVNASQNILTVGRPHLGAQIASYDGYSTGALTVYLPMLFKSAYGGSYNSEFYIQNVDTSHTASFSIKFYDINGNLSCTLNDTLEKLASRNYSVTNEGCLASGWVGGAVVESNYNIVAVGRPLVGTQQMTYNSFSAGSTSIYVPMLFRRVFGTYNAALYIQNVDPTNTATFSLKFYDKLGNLTCTMAGQQRAPLAAKGYWLPTETCVPDGWAGGVLIESNYPLVALARPHVGSEITTYSGIIQTSHSAFVPMLFKKAFGGTYDTALYVQNVDPTNSGNITIDFYSSSGALTCTMTNTLAPMASWGYWLPTEGCMPTGWAGSAVITSTTNIVTVGRPHIGTEVTAYPGLSAGGNTAHLPMLYKNGGPGNNYSSALYVQNLASVPANVTISFFDLAGNLSCVINETLSGTSVKGYWLPSISVCP